LPAPGPEIAGQRKRMDGLRSAAPDFFRFGTVAAKISEDRHPSDGTGAKE
jgi:hypothetical protein